FQEFKPKFVKRYANLREEILRDLKEYVREVQQGEFPTPEYSYE
ncbi:MAG: 3-methyl-2-oxobutanoate hydroxymethyltransferase, partial [Aquificota bacterium]